MEEENKKIEIQDKGIEKTEQIINTLLDEGIQPGNVEYLYKLVDIHKDFENEKYWKDKEENMRYSNYGNFDNYSEGSYGRRGVPGTGRGRYRESGNYGRRGYDTKYRGEDMLNEMYEGYGDYMESGNYGGQETMKALKYMLKSAEDFFKHIQEEAQSPEEIEMVKETAKRISMM